MRKRKPGRPPGQGKPPGEKFVAMVVRFPPEELAAFRAVIPAGDRSLFVRELIRRGLGSCLARRAQEEER